MKYYKLLEHTADLGIRVWGADLKRLFLHAASAMYELIADISEVKPSVSFEVKIEAQDKDALLKDWLSELLYYFHTKDTLLCEFAIQKIDERSVVSTAKGERINPARHNLKHEIKAVTYHSLKIEKEKIGLATDIIFDV